MLKNVQKVVYSGFGLHILSDIPLPELPEKYIQVAQVDVFIEISNLIEHWSEFSNGTSNFVINEKFIMFKIPDVAIYLIQEGSRIRFFPFNSATEDQVRLYLLGTCMGVLLLQRKILPLHGSAIEINGKAYAVVGESGAGKSTLASAFLNSGYKLLSDDIIPVTLAKGKEPVVIPAYPQQKLWRDSLLALGKSSEHLRPIVERKNKFAVPIHSQFVSKPLPLSGVFELKKSENEKIEIKMISSFERFNMLLNHTYRNFLLSASGLLEWHFSFCTKLINQVPFYQLQRPISQFTANDLATLMVTKMIKED